MDKVRLDKWLWAARFFKTRAIAKQAIDGGKVHIDGSKTKPSKEIKVGEELRIRQGYDEKTVIVKALSDQRRGAQIAEQLYEETALSISQRTHIADQRRAAGTHIGSMGRPTKRDRRQIHRFIEKNQE